MLFAISGDYTAEALRAMTDQPISQRREAFSKMLDKAEAKLVAMYFTIASGPGAMAIIDVTDPLAAGAITATLAASGRLANVKVKRLLTDDEAGAIRGMRAELQAVYLRPGQIAEPTTAAAE